EPRLKIGPLENIRHDLGIGKEQRLDFMHLHVRDETTRIVRRIHFPLNLTSHSRLDNGRDLARLLPFCLPDPWPVLRQTIIVKECAHVTTALLSQQRQYLFADSPEVADAAFVA